LLDSDRKSKYDIALKGLLNQRQQSLDQDQVGSATESPLVLAQVLPANSGSMESFSELSAVLEPSDVAASDSEANRSVARSNQSEKLAVDQPSEGEGEEDEVLSAFSHLTDVRYWVAFITFAVVVMTVTVKLLSPSDEGRESVPVASQTEAVPAEIQEPVSVDPLSALTRVQQAADGSFELPVVESHLVGSGVMLAGQSITGWRAGDQADWGIVVKERRGGYFKCLITYQAKNESNFEVHLGNRKPRPLTLYRHEKDFEEEFIVRLARPSKSGEQVIHIKATRAATDVEIKRIRLIPNG